MELYALALMLSLLTISEGTPVGKCPPFDHQEPVVLLAHKESCNKYYMCTAEGPVQMDCGYMNANHDRLQFYVEKQACDWPNATYCGNREHFLLEKSNSNCNIINPVPTECPIAESQHVTIHIAHENDCSKFYTCTWGGKKQLKQCPRGLRFNRDCQVCDWSFNVQCPNFKKIPPLTKTSDDCIAILPVPTQCPSYNSPDYTVHIAHESKCNKFYKCNWGVPIEISCPGDQVWNRECQVCDHPFNVDCYHLYPGEPNTPPNPHTIPPTTTTPIPTQPPPPPTNPTQPPPPPTNPTQPPPPPTNPTQPPPPPSNGCMNTCPNNDPPNYITALPHRDCRKWCRCKNNVVKVFTCVLDYHFSKTLKVCTDPSIAQCTAADDSTRSETIDGNDGEALRNILGYANRFRW